MRPSRSDPEGARRRPPAPAAPDVSPEAVHAAALDLLSRREHARVEIARKLRRRRFPKETIEAVLQRLEAVGLVSDDRYARLYVRDRLSLQPQGRRRIAQGLRAKGVGAEAAARAMAEVYAEAGTDDRETAEALARRRWRLLGSLAPDVARRRLTGYLARRGFEAAIVTDVVRRLTRSAETP